VDKKAVEALENGDIHKTEIFASKTGPEIEAEETVVQPSEKEITIDKIADEISRDETTSERNKPITEKKDIIGPTDISGTQQETSSSEISIINSSKTELDDNTTGKRKAVSRYQATGASVPKDKSNTEKKPTPKQSISRKPLSGQPMTGQPMSGIMYEKTGTAPKRRPPKSNHSFPKEEFGGIQKRETIISVIPIILLLAVFFLYPFISLKNYIPLPEYDLSELESETLYKVSKYYSFDSVDALMSAGNLLLDTLKKVPKSTRIKGSLAKLYADLGRMLRDKDLLRTSLELSLETLSDNPKEPDALRALAVYNLNSPETSSKFLNKAIEAKYYYNDPQPNPEDFYLEAQINIKTGNIKKASEKLKQAIDTDGDYIRALRSLRNIHKLNGEKSMAKLAQKRILSLENNFYNVYPELKPKGVEILKTPKPTVSPTVVPTKTRTVIIKTKTPTPAPTYVRTRTPVVRTVRTPRYTPTPKLALWDIKHQKAQKYYSRAKYIAAEKELTDAINACAKQCPKRTRSSTLSRIHTTLGYTYSKLYKQDSAMNSFLSAIKNNPRNAAAHKGLAQIYDEFGETTMAIKEYKLYLKYNPRASDRWKINKRIKKLGG